ncbi:MAG TPA: MBL fold metallo-hydrolase [Blastocatellia bacterium]|nr:MBL fold metallo-hydrolase [Blastocatellia bacterium]
MANLQFLGATGTVTGSKFALEVGGSRAMVDCGLFQGFKELRQRNWEPLPIKESSIGWVLLTHAHIDHSGYLPRLVRDGFTGPVYATPATADLLKIMLPDSAKIQEEDAEYANRKGYSKHHPALPLYTEADANRALKQVQGVKYYEEVRLSKFLRARFIPAGHILGSSFVEAVLTEPEREPVKVLFSGDIGRYDEPILNDPAPVEEADYLLVESTYGGRLHEATDPKDCLAEIINRTAERGGKVIIPAFAVGRSQLLVYYLRELEDEGRIPVLPVAIDSPMGASVTRLYNKHKDDHDVDMQRLARINRNALATRNFSLVQGRSGSKALNGVKGPAIIISASGMATGGRVLHHLAQHLPDPASAVVLVGYQAAGTRGRRLQDGEKEIKIHGEMVPVRAHIESIGSLSAHADSAEILKWLSGFKRPPRTTFIIHGEPESAEALRQKIVSELGWNAVIPKYKEVVELV